METVLSLLIGLGLSAACGFRVFVPFVVVGVAVRTGHLRLSEGFAWMGSDAALIAFGVAAAVEIAVFDLVIHDIDFANFAVGMPDGIRCNYLPGEYSSHDYVSAMWSYNEKDVHVKIEGGFTFHSHFPFQASYMAQFEKASVLFTTLKGDIIQIADDSGISDVPAGDGGDGYFNEINYFAQCLRDNSQPAECSPVSSLQAIELCYNHIK